MRRALVLAASCAICCEAAAQQSVPAVTYERSYFDAFEPRTALDMVRRVPGFSLDEGEERRGFAAATGNVMIDGAAPIVKAEDLEDILERIPAADVVRIELIRGEGASASSAQAVRINLVRRPSSGAGVWEFVLEHAGDGRLSPAAETSWSGRRGVVEYQISAGVERTHAPLSGEDLSFDSAGVLEEVARERITEDEREAVLAGELTFPLAGGALKLTGSLSTEASRERESAHIVEFDVFDGIERVEAREREEVGELGASYARLFGAWETEAALLVTRRRLEDDEFAEERDAAGAFDESETERRRLEAGESILRTMASREIGGVDISLALELAENTLEQRLTLIEDEGAGPVPVEAPGANVSIEEGRGEAWATAAWRAGEFWRLETSLAVEMSRLTQSGDSSLVTELTYWKPSLQAVRRLGDDDQVRIRLYRDVGQLDFEDFAASADLAGDEVLAGNANLRPQTSWRLETAADWRFEGGALELTLFYWRIQDALDFVVIGPPDERFDTRGNVGDGSLVGLRTALEIPVPILPGARLRFEGLWQETEVTDPLTGQLRLQSEAQESLITAEFRQDLPSFGMSWGMEFQRERLAPEFRFDRVTREEDADDFEVWLETTRFGSLKARVFASNLLNAREIRERRLFDPDRLGAVSESERRDRRLGSIIGVQLQGTF